MNETIAGLLTTLETVSPAQLTQDLASVGLLLTEDDWSGLLYGIEEVGINGRFHLAEQFIAVCFQVAQANKNAWAVRSITYFSGNLYYLQGKASQSIAAYQAVVEAGRDALDEDARIQAALAQSRLARVLMAQGHIAEAVTAIEAAIEMETRLGRQTDVVGDQITLAGLYLIQENFSQSEALLTDTLAQTKSLGHPELTTLTLMRLASIKEDLNDPAAALPYYEAALAELDAVDEPEDEDVFFTTYRETLIGLGMVYEALERPLVAIEYYAEASRLTHFLKDTRNQAVVLTWLGTAQLAAGRPALAVRSFQAAERLAHQSHHTWWLGTNSFFWAAAWQALGEWDRAETAVYQALQIHSAAPGEHSADEVGCLVKLGEIALARGDGETAVSHYQQALTHLRHIELGQMHRLIYLRLGEAYWHQEMFTAAYQSLRQALDVYESKRKSVSELWARVDYAPSRDLVYDYLVRTCLALGKVGEAYTAVEEGRMRVFREQLAAQPAPNHSIDMANWSTIKQSLTLKTR